MATATMTQNQNQNQGRGGARRGRGGNRGGRGQRANGATGAAQTVANANAPADAPGPASDVAKRLAQTAAAAAAAAAAAGDEDEDVQLCWICAEPVKYWSVSECNHRTCHVCALRLRALYKKTDCTFCKEPQSTVIFTVSPDAVFASYAPESTPYKDARLQIHFETQEMMEETMILLRFNCADPTCDYIAAGWGDLKLHVRGAHGRQMCDLCIRHKKVFAHEHALYTAALLAAHLPSLPGARRTKPPPPEQVEGGVHPLCEFCRECFFSGDELYPHMREQHEECFVCKRLEVRDQHFQNYAALEKHFGDAHFPCAHAECLAKKFVVFPSAMDLQAHMVQEHGGAMSARDRRDAMRVQADFSFEEVPGAGRGRRTQAQAQQQQAGPSRGGRRREFGGHLTAEGPPPPPVPPRAPSPPHIPLSDDPEVIQRQAQFLARVRAMAAQPANADLVVRTAIRAYKASESGARDLIGTAWTVLDGDVENTATVVNALVDLLDDEDKKRELLAAWNGFKIERRQEFPDLVPTAVGSGFAGVASGRVLNAKSATAQRARGTGPQNQIWDRVAQAASSSSSGSAPQRHIPGAFAPAPAPAPASGAERFPALGPGGRGAQGIARTAWSASGASSSAPAPAPAPPAPVIRSVPGPAAAASGGKKKAQPTFSAAAFPTLPSAGGGPRAKVQASGNQSLRNILGEPAPVANPWAGGDGGAEASHAPAPGPTRAADEGGKGKKKGKGKQMLFTMGTIPS